MVMRALAVAVHAQLERAGTAVHEVAVERPGDRADRVLEEGDALGERVVVEGEEAADHIAVTSEVLGGRVHDDVRPQRQRMLQRGGGKGVVDHHQRAVLMGDRAERLDVDDPEPRVAGRLDPHHARRRGPGGADGGEVGQVDRVDAEARRRVHLAREADRATVGIVRAAARDPRARAVGAARPRRPCPTRTRTRGAAPSSAARWVSSAVRVGLPLRAYSYPACWPTASCRKVVASEIGGTTAPVARSGAPAPCTALVPKPFPSRSTIRRVAGRRGHRARRSE